MDDNFYISPTYIISRDDIENSMESYSYSKNEKYHTVRIDDDVKTCEVDISGYEIMKGDPDCPVPEDEFDLWYGAVMDFLYDHNTKVDTGSGITVEFEILDVDARGAYKYIEKVNGNVTKEDVGFYRDLETQAEKLAWIEAVKAYKKANDIPTPTSVMKEQMDEIDSKISKLDENLFSGFDPVAPTIVTALPKLAADPCDFLSYLSQAGALAIPLVNGVIPQPYDMATYAIKKITGNIPVEIQSIADMEVPTAAACYAPVRAKISSSEEYFGDLDALYDEYAKTNNSDIVLFETVLEPPYNYSPNTLIYENSEPGDLSFNQLPGAMATDTYEYDPNSTEYNYKEVTLSKIYDRGAKYKPSDLIRQRIIDALKNFWVPLRKGWETYAKSIGLDPTWGITSGYRPVGYVYTDGTVQKATGSAHIEGWAIDVQPRFSNITEKRDRVQKMSSFVYNFLKNNPSIQFDQILVEHSGPIETATSLWIHMGYKNPSGKQRRQYWPSYRSDAKSGQHGQMYTI